MSRGNKASRAFLEAIREAPEDDAPRLVYADWLDDHGDAARAEFIRVQCELARGKSNKARRAELEERELELLSANRRLWLGPLDRELGYEQCTFRRGFPEEVTVRPRQFVTLAKEFDARVPAGRLTLSGGFSDPAMKSLLACPYLDWVVGLKYEHPRLTESGLEMVARATTLPRLAELSVQFAVFSTSGLRTLTTSPHRRGLRRLELHYFDWEEGDVPQSADALADPGVHFRLHSLSLYGHRLGPEGATVLAATENLAKVKELDLTHNALGDAGAIALARSPYLRGLSFLMLQTNNLTSKAVRELVDSPLLDGIRTLNLGVNDVGDRGARVLATSPRLASLEGLLLYGAHLTDRGAEALAASPHLRNLTRLELVFNSLTDRGSQALFDSPYLQRLERISISGQSAPSKIISQQQRKQWKQRLGEGANV